MIQYVIDDSVNTGSGDNNDVFIQPGIHDGLTFTGIELIETEKSKRLQFKFVNEKGEVLSHSEFEITPRKPYEQLTDEEKSKLATRISSQLKKIKQIMQAIKNETSVYVRGNNFKELAQNVTSALNSYINTAKVRAKVVLNSGNFGSLDNNPKYTFIENMSISKEDSKIKMFATDKVTPSMNSTPSRNSKNPFDTNSSNDVNGDLPF